MNHLDFQDPYTVEGTERAKRFAHNFKAQELFGPSGFKEQCAIIREADGNLLPDHLEVFGAEIGHAPSSRAFKTFRELGERYHRWETAFGSESSSLALFEVIYSLPVTFEYTFVHGETRMYMDAGELRELVVKWGFCID